MILKVFLILLLLVPATIHLLSVKKHIRSNRFSADASGFILFTTMMRVLAFVLFFYTAFAVFNEFPSWWFTGFLSVILSQLVIITRWKHAKWSTVFNLVLLFFVIAGMVDLQFDKKTRVLEYALIRSSSPKKLVISEAMITDLPAPVQKWLRGSGVIGKEAVNLVRLEQEGFMRQDENNNDWKKISAVQYINVRHPAFLWSMEMEAFPGLKVKGRDQYQNGKGNMQIKALSLVNIVNESGSKTDMGSLQRFLAEICWAPSAALNKLIHWEAIDASSAKAILSYKGSEGSVVFHFNKAGDIIKCTADRYMSSSSSRLEKWEVRNTHFKMINGFRIPVASEVTWKLKNGDFTWYKFRIKAIAYNAMAQRNFSGR